jgi:acylphosphatase
MKCIHIHIYGNVQHKGFRFVAMEKAYQHGIRGYIQNKKDGSLFIEAEGEEEQMNGFLEWCKKGPMGSIVEEITTEEGEIRNYKSFDIK